MAMETRKKPKKIEILVKLLPVMKNSPNGPQMLAETTFNAWYFRDYHNQLTGANELVNSLINLARMPELLADA